MASTTQTVPPVAGRIQIPQYSLARILAVWAAAALPMAALAWVVAPWLADRLTGPAPMARSLITLLAAGLVWQFVVVMWLIRREQGTLRWSVVREALWLKPPTSPETGRVGGRVWLTLFLFGALFSASEMVPRFASPADRDFGTFLGSPDGIAFFDGAWGWFAVVMVMLVFNTVLGEELLFRGLLLPRMSGVFGKGDWIANGVLFALYHLHMPWAIPAILTDTFALSYPSKRYRSAWMGIIVHSLQTVLIGTMLLLLVL